MIHAVRFSATFGETPNVHRQELKTSLSDAGLLARMKIIVDELTSSVEEVLFRVAATDLVQKV